MNNNEKLYLKWLEEQKAKGVKSVTYSTTDGDTSSEEFRRTPRDRDYDIIRRILR